MKIVLLVTFIFLASLAYESYAARNYVDSMCYAAMWNSGANAKVKKIYPLKRASGSGYMSAAQYYSYSTPYGASANTPDGLEESSVAQYYFFDDDKEVSIFFYFDKWRDPSGGVVGATITSEGLAGKGAQVTVRDDPGDSSYAWNDSDGTSTPFWRWWPCCTDGMVLGKLPQPVEKLANGNNPNFNPSDHSFCVNMKFTEQEGVTQFKVQTLRNYLEVDPARVIEFFPIPSNQANTLRLCYTQCNCIQNAVLEANRGTFDNKAVVEGNGAGSGIGRYAPGTSCSWIIEPVINPDYVAVYFKEFVFAQYADDDYVEFARDRDGNVVVDRFAQNGQDDLDWTAQIAAGRNIPHPNKGAINLSEYNKLMIQKSGAKFEAKVSFTSAPSSPGAAGFTVTYVSVATTEGLAPDQINDAGGVTVTVTGRFILNERYLTCRITLDAGATEIYVLAKYVSATEATCVVPAKPATVSANAGTISISNDGVTYFDEQPFTYYSASCNLLTDCASCTASPVCGWCASVANYYGASSCMTIPTPATPTVPPPECPSPANTWHHDCCNRCPANMECNGNGVCECNQTCTCGTNTAGTIQYTGDSCECSCPVGLDNKICSGLGECDCGTGTCTCEFPARGDTCECVECRGDERGPCYGSGTCNCDGTCTCQAGFNPETDCQCPTTCQLGSNGLVCGGEAQGECVCGDCICKEGFTSSDVCDCQDRCTANPNVDDCYGHGACGCDGVCTCDVGYTGKDCDKEVECLQTSCETCQDSITDAQGTVTDQSFCVWCPQSGQCVHEGKSQPCYDATMRDDTLPADQADEKVYLLAAECPVIAIQDTNPIRQPDDSLPIAAVIAAIIGVVLAIIIGAILAFLGKTQTEGLATFDFGQDTMGAATQNPLFAGSGTGGTSSIYQGK